MPRIIVMLFLCLATCSVFAAEQWEARWAELPESVIERERATIWLEVFNLNGSSSVNSNIVTVEPLQSSEFFYERSAFPNFRTVLVDGEKVSAIAFRFDLFPRKAGELTLPEAVVAVGDYQIKSAKKVVSVASQPAEAKGAMSAVGLSVSQKISNTEVVAGAMVQRTVRISTDDLPGYLIPRLTHPKAALVSVHEFQGTATTSNERGILKGQRTFDYRYEFHEAGTYLLPEIKFQWWNKEAQKLSTATLDKMEVVVVPPPPLSFKQRLDLWMITLSEISAKQWCYGFLVLALLIVVIRLTVLKWHLLKKRCHHFLYYRVNAQLASFCVVIAAFLLPQHSFNKVKGWWSILVESDNQVLRSRHLSTLYKKALHQRQNRINFVRAVVLLINEQHLNKHGLKPLNR